MTLILRKTTLTEGDDLASLLEEASKGDEILLHSGKSTKFRPHPKGVVVLYTDGVMLNQSCIQKIPRGQKDAGFGLSGENIVIRVGDRIYINKKEVYQGQFSSYHAHKDGFIIEKDNILLLNGEKKVFNFAKNREETSSWGYHPDGFIIKDHDKLLLNGKKLLYRGEFSRFQSHEKGVVIQQGNKLLMNGTDLLHKGNYAYWFVEGDMVILINYRGELIINGETFYHKKCDSYTAHTNGVLIAKDNEIFLRVYK